MSNVDPRVEAAAKLYAEMIIGYDGYERANPETRAALEGDASLILAAADSVDPMRDEKTLIKRISVGISGSAITDTPILTLEEDGGMISVRVPDLARAALTPTAYIEPRWGTESEIDEVAARIAKDSGARHPLEDVAAEINGREQDEP